MKRRIALTLGATATAAVAAASIGGVPASAAGDSAEMQGGAISAPLESGQQARAGGSTGWTAKQMRAAIPVERTLSATQHAKVQGAKVDLGRSVTIQGKTVATASKGSAKTAAEQACSLPPTNTGSLYQGCEQFGHYKQQGKMFFLDPSKPAPKNRFVCSATSITAGNKSTVLTAGHCLHKGSGGTQAGFMKEVVFVPAYKDGAAPYGQWKGVNASTTNAWATSANYAGDVAYFTVGKVGGKTLADTVGTTGIAFGATHQGSQTYAFGYPADAPFDGSDPYFCSGKSFAGLSAGTKGLNCRMTGGASGGGWEVGLNVSTGAGSAISVNSYKNKFDVSRMYGPHFGQAAQDTYNLIQGIAVP
ncbi:trypsin-like serine peptidase [Demetria terragena]|uniref:trypsin-like serine peptidase n=1 Tax=Demetria terragena TaxID=63959 RepID=UPI00037AEFC3|nr:hypothetical protein [Demetria terragena]